MWVWSAPFATLHRPVIVTTLACPLVLHACMCLERSLKGSYLTLPVLMGLTGPSWLFVIDRPFPDGAFLCRNLCFSWAYSLVVSLSFDQLIRGT